MSNRLQGVVTDPLFPNCPIRNVLARISGKWALLVLYTLKSHPGVAMRFSALRRSIPDISQKMLTSTLRVLESDGFVARKVYAEVPPRVEYSLTARALSLMPVTDLLIDWAGDNMAAIINDRRQAEQNG